MQSVKTSCTRQSLLKFLSTEPSSRRLLHTSALWKSDHSASAKLFADAAAEEATSTTAQQYTGAPTGSAKLFADAAAEEAEGHCAAASSPRLSFLEKEHENWTGDERMEDAVLRMLVDKYRPLRSGPIRTADEKLKHSPPQINVDFSGSVSRSSHTHLNAEPILPGIEGHKPWMTTFKAPSHAVASVKVGNFPPISARASVLAPPVDEKTKKKEREVMKRSQTAGRLTKARESTLDYRLGVKAATARMTVTQQSRPNPSSIRGWQGLVEDRIERARQAGHFTTIKGRGKPLARYTDEHNPFIGREEFLMNRIVQRNGAAPPWVELQGELETAVNSFREVLRQSWVRRAIRVLTLSDPAPLLRKLTLARVTNMRDVEWETRERAYHETAIEEVNSLVRKYNGLAPYSVRRPYYSRDAELAKVYAESGEDILRGISERLRETGQLFGKNASGDEKDAQPGMDHIDLGPTLGIWDVIRAWLLKLMGRS